MLNIHRFTLDNLISENNIHIIYTQFYSISPLFGPDIEDKHTKLSKVFSAKANLFGSKMIHKTIKRNKNKTI